MPQETQVLWLSQKDVIAGGGLDMAATVDDVEEVFRLRALGEYALPRKVSLEWAWEETPTGEQRNHLNLMSGYVGGQVNVAGFKPSPAFPATRSSGICRGPRPSSCSTTHRWGCRWP